MASVSILFAGEALVKVLALFLLNPEQEYYQTEIYQHVGGALHNVQKALMKLEKTGFIDKVSRGRMSYYKANRQNPGFEDLKRLFLKTISLGDVMKSALLEHRGEIEASFIFGSVATGLETAGSDIDLLVLGKMSLREQAEILSPLQKTLDREINAVVYSPDEFRRMVKEKNHFALELLTCPKIWLIGTEDEFKRVAGRGKA